jgi:hypothetical protein
LGETTMKKVIILILVLVLVSINIFAVPTSKFEYTIKKNELFIRRSELYSLEIDQIKKFISLYSRKDFPNTANEKYFYIADSIYFYENITLADRENIDDITILYEICISYE